MGPVGHSMRRIEERGQALVADRLRALLQIRPAVMIAVELGEVEEHERPLVGLLASACVGNPQARGFRPRKPGWPGDWRVRARTRRADCRKHAYGAWF